MHGIFHPFSGFVFSKSVFFALREVFLSSQIEETVGKKVLHLCRGTRLEAYNPFTPK